MTGGTSLDFGRAGLLAQRAALVNCETREKFLSGPDVVRKTFLIFDLSPEDDDDNGAAGTGTTCIKYIKLTQNINIFERLKIIRIIRI